jgi:hypothetical protein
MGARLGGEVAGLKAKARYRLEGAYAVEWAVRAVDVMFGLSGAAGLYESGHAARAFRDAHAVKQHFSFNTDIAGHYARPRGARPAERQSNALRSLPTHERRCQGPGAPQQGARSTSSRRSISTFSTRACSATGG